MATPQRSGMSLYANLLESTGDSKAASPGSDPRKLDDTDKTGGAQRPIDPALRFQPIRRPQVKQAKPKHAFAKATPTTATSASETTSATIPATGPSSTTAAAPQRSTLADWAPTEEDEWLYSGVGKRPRGGRRSKKKKDEGFQETDWDDLYDPARPTNVEEYLRSDERIREIRDWKAVLYAHRRKRRGSGDSDRGSDEEDDTRGTGNQFAPPASYSFAPPPLSPTRDTHAATGDDAYARRLALSATQVPPPPPPPPEEPPQPAEPGVTISRAPVRYEPASQPPDADSMDVDDSDGDDNNVYIPPSAGVGESSAAAPPGSIRPGQAGFAQRLMSKYGWTKGSGLGADETGITSALRVEVSKRRKKPDAEGGGWAEPGARGKIIGGKRKAVNAGAQGEQGEGYGPMSQVIVLRGMLDGMADLRSEVEAGLGQEIGEECGEKYGRVERLYIDVDGPGDGKGVFIKFTDQVSALRAVNALQNRIFNGNAIVAKFYDLEKFEQGIRD